MRKFCGDADLCLKSIHKLCGDLHPVGLEYALASPWPAARCKSMALGPGVGFAFGVDVGDLLSSSKQQTTTKAKQQRTVIAAELRAVGKHSAIHLKP